MIKKLMEKKEEESKGKKLSSLNQEAKMNVLKKLANDAEDSMSGKLKKVVISSDSKEGLLKGIDLAQEKLTRESEEESSEEHDEENEEESEEETKEEKIARLEAELEALKE